MEICSKILGVPSYAHMYRHFFVSYLRRESVPIDIIKDIVGHEDVSMSQKYDDNPKEDGFLSSIGSGNQIVWDIPNRVGFAMKDIKGIYLLNSDVLSYNLNSNAHAYTLHQKEVK
jgi:hypothetical protein